jgi:hypothetical protein
MQTLIMEHKTSSEDIGLGSFYWQRLTLDSQVSKYFAGARAIGHDVDGCLYDVLGKPALRPLGVTKTRLEPETPVAYHDRCLAAIAEHPDRYYQRGVVVRLESEERDAAFDTWQTADQIRLSRNADRWPRNVDSCDLYHRPCDFFPICSGVAAEDDARYEVMPPHVELDARAHLPLLTTSSCRCYRACPRQYQLTYVKGLRARAAAPTLAFGTRVHKALAAWLPAHDLDAALAAMREDGAESEFDFDGAKAEAMIRGYHARWSGDALEVVAIEREFVAPLVNPTTGAASRTFCLAGKLDAIVRRTA